MTATSHPVRKQKKVSHSPLKGIEPRKKTSTIALDNKNSNNYSNVVGPIQKIIVSDLWSDDSAAVEHGLRSLADSCCYTADGNQTAQQHRDTIFHAHGASAILGAMKRWGAVAEIQAVACRALCNVGSNSVAFWETANALGAIPMIVSAMETYPDDERVQLCGCSALFCVLWVAPRDNATTNSTVYDTVDGIRAVLRVVIAAMKRYPATTDLQICACAAIKGLSRWEQCRVFIVEAGGLGALATLIETFRKDPSVDVQRTVKRARAVLKQLA